MKTALIFGATGQLGYYLSEFLKKKEYRVVCPNRNDFNFESLDSLALSDLLRDETPNEIYNFVGLNYAPDSWYMPQKYMAVNGLAVQKLLTAMKETGPLNYRYFQAGSAEVFDKATVQQAEDTNRLPENPYGVSKMLAMELVRIYREKFRFFACTGIFFNSESTRRDKFFFAEKVAHEAVRIAKANRAGEVFEPMKLGSLGARRDWGWAPEYVEVAWKMLQQENPNDFVIGTGEVHSCFEFVVEALRVAGLPDVLANLKKYVQYDEGEIQERSCMQAITAKAEHLLGWKAQYKFEDVVRMLVGDAMVKSEEVLGQSAVIG